MSCNLLTVCNWHSAAAAEQLKHACLENVSSDVLTDSSDSDDHVAEDSDDSEDGNLFSKSTAESTGSSHQKKRTGTTVSIPPDILKKTSIVSLATRLKMTPTQKAAFTQDLTFESGSDVSRVASSYTTAHCS